MECLCEQGTPQMYKAKCAKIIKKVTDVMPIQKVANDGTLNSINLGVIPIPEINFTALFNKADASKRMHHLTGLKNFEETPGEAKLKTWNDDSTTKLSDGPRMITFIIPDTSPQLAGFLTALECGANATFLKTIGNQLIGYADPKTIASDKRLYPLPVERWEVKANIFATDSETAMTAINIYFPATFNIGNIVVVEGDEHLMVENKYYEAKPAIVKAGATPPTTTTMNVLVTRPSGGILGNSAPVSGLLLPDFFVQNITTASPITVLTVIETPAGDYALTFAAQSSLDQVDTSLIGTSGYVSNVSTQLIP